MAALIAAPQSCVISGDYRVATLLLESALTVADAYAATNFVYAPRCRSENLWRHQMGQDISKNDSSRTRAENMRH